MRKLLPALLLLFLIIPANVRAMWANVPLEELVQESDLIVVGTLRDVSEHTADGMDYGEGRIVVRAVIWGRVSPGDSLLLKWQNSSTIACPRVEHKYNANEEGIWLLTRDGEAVAANYPGRFVELKERRAVLKALAQTPVALRSGDPWVGDDRPMSFEVIYRNTSGAPRRFPGVGYDEDGQALLPHGSRLSVKIDGNGEPKPVRLAGRHTCERSLEPITLRPGEEQRFVFDLRGLLASAAIEDEIYISRASARRAYYRSLASATIKDEIYIVTLKLPGRRPTNEVVFYTSEREEPGAEPPAPPPSAVDYSGSFAAPGEKSVYLFKKPSRDRVAPLTRAALVALAALLLFPFFYRLRTALGRACLARVAHGAHRWQT